MINTKTLNQLKLIWKKYNAIKISLKNGSNYTFFVKETEKWQIDRHVIINTVKEIKTEKNTAVFLRNFADQFMRMFNNYDYIIASVDPSNISIIENLLHIDVCFKNFEENYSNNRVPFDPIYDLLINTDEIIEFKPLDYSSINISLATELANLFEEEHRYLSGLLKKMINIESEVNIYKAQISCS